MSQKVITANPCRLSYPALFQPRAPQNGQGDPKFQASLLIPKTDTATVNQMVAAIQAEMSAASAPDGTWKGRAPAQPTLTWYDGDQARPSDGEEWGDECHGCYVLRTSAKNKPDIVDEFGQKVLDATKFYAGCWCYFSINFAAWENTGKKGVGAFLNCVMFARDGDPLSAHASAADDFADIIKARQPMTPDGYPAALPGAAPQMQPQIAPMPQQQYAAPLPGTTQQMPPQQYAVPQPVQQSTAPVPAGYPAAPMQWSPQTQVAPQSPTAPMYGVAFPQQ